MEREEFRVYAKNVYKSKETHLKEKNKKSIAEDSSRAVSRKKVAAGAPSRRKYEGL